MKTLIRNFFALPVMFVITGLMVQSSFASISSRKLQLKNIFVPSVGYDDNDNIQVTLDGYVPNICYSAVTPVFTINRDLKVIQVEQYAVKKPIQGCSDDEILTNGFNFPVSFTNVIDLGVLPEGDYLVRAEGEDGKQVERKFNVSKAAIGSVDNSLYAPIKSAFIPDMIYATPNAEVVLSGVLDSACMRLNPRDIEVQRQGNVIVVLPKMTIRSSADCTYHPRPLQLMLPIGALNKGRYLLHIRTITGGAINRVFSVIDRSHADNRSSSNL